MTADTRSPPRSGDVHAAAIWIDDRVASLDCIVHDLSEHGCRLLSTDARRAPDRFELTLGHDDLFVEECEVVARSQSELRVRFRRR